MWQRKIARGQRAPDRFYDRPDIWPQSSFYWSAFYDLVTERQVGMGVGNIPYSKVADYAARHGIFDEDDFLRFWAIIRELDSEQLKFQSSKDYTKQRPTADQDNLTKSRPSKRQMTRSEK